MGVVEISMFSIALGYRTATLKETNGGALTEAESRTLDVYWASDNGLAIGVQMADS